MFSTVIWAVAMLLGVGIIVWGAETFAKHLAAASAQLGVSSFALAILLAGAEPEELATAVAASAHKLPAIALGDVIGANITMCLVALGVGALIAPLPFGGKVLQYACLGLPLGAFGIWFAWDGLVSRIEGAVLVLLYIAYVLLIWMLERKPPDLGEVKEIEEAAEHQPSEARPGWELALVLAGVAAMAIGSILLVDAAERLAPTEHQQTVLGLTVIGFATGFELVVLAWATARRGASEAAIAAVVGSFAYNITMTLGAAALVRPLQLLNAVRLHVPLLIMIGSLALVIILAIARKRLRRMEGAGLIAAYIGFVAYIVLRAQLRF